MTFGVMFHHFHNNVHKPTQGSISSNEFIKIIKFLREKYNLINAANFFAKINNKTIKKNDVCLTFDDNLKSQIDIALPILIKEKIQAFFFLYTNAFTNNPSKLEMFRDFRNTRYKKIDFFYKDFFLILKKKYPIKFKLMINNFNSKYLKNYSFYSLNDRKFRFCRDKVLNRKIYETLMLDLFKKKKYNYIKQKKKILMSKKDVKKLLKLNQIVGLHSHSHSVNISELPYNKQLIDYKKNILFFKKNFGFKAKSMSYPFGRYNSSTKKVLKKIGIKIGFLSNFNKKKKFSEFEISRCDHTFILKKI